MFLRAPEVISSLFLQSDLEFRYFHSNNTIWRQSSSFHNMAIKCNKMCFLLRQGWCLYWRYFTKSHSSSYLLWMVMGLKLVIKIPVKNMNVISTSATSLMNYLHLFIIIFHKSSLIYLVLHFLGIHTNCLTSCEVKGCWQKAAD